MEQLESQIAKIQLGNFKKTNSYVFALAEKAPAGSSELYVVAELPLFNPAAEEACAAICMAIASGLRRCYKKTSNDNTFENAIGQINDELGKLASMGQTHWIDKLSCMIAVKESDKFWIATCGKVSAYLFRNGDFTDISCSATRSHPLKTFENVACGKLKLGDITILSTTELFNYLSIDRLKNILQSNQFLAATQTIVEILKENAGPEVAFGTILNLQVPLGATTEDQIDLEDYTKEPERGESLFKKVFAYGKSAIAMDSTKRVPQVSLPKISIGDTIKNATTTGKSILDKSSSVLSIAGKKMVDGSKKVNVDHFRGFSKQKKFFFVCMVILLVAVVANLFITSHYKKAKLDQSQATANLTAAQDLLSKVESSLLYKNENDARNFLSQAQAKLPSPDGLTSDQQKLYATVKGQMDDVKKQIEKTTPVDVTVIGSLGQSDHLLSLPPYVATQVGSSIVSYNKTTGQTQDGSLLSSEKIVSSVYTKGTTAIVYNGTGLLVWDYAKKQFGTAFTQSVPVNEDTASLKYYATNSRVYLINKKTNQIISFLIGTNSLSKPVVATKNANDLANSIDMAIDGSIYVLNKNGINKYQSGVLADFQMPFLLTPFSGSGKIFTDKDTTNIYVLDAGNNRILVISKKGDLIASYTNDQFTKLKDFQVDEKGKTIYVLNDATLLKVTMP